MAYPEQIKLEKELFDMVYAWGRIGIVVDFTAPAFQDKLQEFINSLQ